MADLVKVIDVRANVAKAEQELGRLQGRVKQLQERKKGLNKALKDGKISQDRYEKAMGRTTIQMKKAQMGVRQYSKSILAANGAMKKTSGFVMGIRKAITGLAMQFLAFTAVIQVIRNVVGVFSDFEQANADLSAVLGVTGDEMKELTEDAKRLGATTAFTASEVSQLQKEYAKLGFSQQEILDATEATLSLAAATGTDLPRAAEVVGSTIRAFGMDASEAQRVTDVMAKSFSSSALDMEKFATAMRSVAPVAKNAGLNIEQTTSLLGVLTDRGVDASTSGTALRNVFLELSKQGLTYEEAMRKINTSTDKNKTALELFGKRGAVVGTILAETGADAEALKEKLDNAGGSAEEMATKQLDTLQGSLTILNSAWEGFILSLEDGSGFLSKALKFIIQDISRGLSQLSGSTDEASQKFSIVGANLQFMVAKFKMAIYPFQVMFRLWRKIASLFENHLSPQIEIFTNKISNKLSPIITEIKTKIKDLITPIKEVVGVIKTFIKSGLANLGISDELKRGINAVDEILTGSTEKAKADAEKLAEEKKDLLDKETLDKITAVEEQAALEQELTKAEQKELDKREKEREKAEQKRIKQQQKYQQLRLELATQEAAEKTKALLKEIAENTLANESRTKAVIEQMEVDADIRMLKAETLDEERLATIDKENAEFQEKRNVKALRENATDEEIKVHNAKRELLQAQHTKKLEDIDKKFETIKQENRNKDLQSSASFIGALAGLAEQGSATQKGLMSAQALISTYLSAQKAYESQFVPLATVDSPIRGVIAAATATISGLARVAKINGVKFAEGGVLRGKSHARGGIPTIDGQYEFEGGEAVINKRSTAKYGALLSGINQAGGGVAFEKGGITKFQDGGINAPISFPDVGTDATGVAEQLTAQMGAIKVVNVVSETTDQQNSILNVQSEAEFG